MFCRWLSHIDSSPGFSEETLHLLRDRARASGNRPLEVALVIDGMSIRKHITWDSSRQRFVGYVNYGAGDDATEEATEVVCFMVVSIFQQWKLPMGYFFTHGLPGYVLSRLIIHAIQCLHENGICVVTLTMDGHQANQAAFKQLGATLKGNIRSSFPHPNDPSQKILAIFDPCHMIKLIRNALHAYGESNWINELSIAYITKIAVA